MLAAVITFFLKNWKLVVGGVILAALLSWIGVVTLERNHYKAEYADTKLALDTLVKDSKARQNNLQADADAITKKYNSAHDAANTLAIEASRLTQEKIKSDKELAATRLSLNAVRMFNASKPTAPAADTAPAAVSVDVGKASPAATPAPEVSQFSLADLLAQSAKNDEEHLRCIKQVTDWQHFWSDFTAAVAASEVQP